MNNNLQVNSELASVFELIPKNIYEKITDKEYQVITPFVTKMVNFVDENHKKISCNIIADFITLFLRFLKNKEFFVDWSKVKEIKPEQIFNIKELGLDFNDIGQKNLDKLVVLKLNGGLGTSMGLHFAKSKILVDVKYKRTFLHIIKEQIDELNKKYQSKIPLWFFNSFNTQKDTKEILGENCYFELIQNEFPRIKAENMFYQPFEVPGQESFEWHPPGHGDIYRVFKDKKFLEQMLAQGKEYLFVSNADNLGATVDLKILGFLINRDIDFLMEVSKKTMLDKKGGILVQYCDQISLIEAAQVLPENQADFEDINKFSYFNTNSLWFNIRALLAIINQGFDLPLLINRKKINNNLIIQLETAMGAIIEFFPKAKVCLVPKARFIPVKTNRELLLLRSDFVLKEKGIILNNARILNNVIPKIVLSSNYAYLDDFENYIQNIPSLVNIKSLNISGSVFFLGKKSAVLQGEINLESLVKPLEIFDDVCLVDVSIKADDSDVAVKSLNSEAVFHYEKQHNKIIIKGFDFYKNPWQTQLLILKDRILVSKLV
ncbi:MAG: UTP--glucose-1-phosphate uridylyltransferase [Candidatus Margulisiibacteriota bacterium]|jgi:UTP--glucose-1-phosphate uridylyltransferase